MRSALLAALLVTAALAAHESGSAPAASNEREPEQEDESDSAPFMIVVEHPNGRRCGGSLVSLRTALTSAGCVRGQHGAAPRELWALAPGAGAVQRVARVTLAAGNEPAPSPAGPATPGAAWDAAMDLAVLELEAPFGGGTRSRPILMATQPAECAPRASCHVVRALGRAPRLRIMDAVLVPGEACAERARGWPGLRDSALCLVGPTLCASDWGAGVVCEGKLCGVLSRSARSTSPAGADSTEAGEALDSSCGDTHVAQSVARWRRFLHCAHTLRACGRGGECAQLCSEQRLLEAGGGAGTAGSAGSPAPAAPRRASPSSAAPAPPDTRADTEPPVYSRTSPLLIPDQSSSRAVSTTMMDAGEPRAPPTRSAPPPRSPPAPPAPAAPPVSPARAAFEFEPNRPDFKGGPARTSRVYLKAGEYGDNGADYGGEDAPPAAAGAPAPQPAPPTRSPARASPATPARAGELQARVSPAAAPRAHSRRAPAPRARGGLLLLLAAITYVAN